MSLQPIVYIVDDDEAMTKSLSWLVESVSLRARSFSSAQQFLDHYEPGSHGCLLLDVRMPGMSGLDLHAKLLAEQIHIPVIIITGHADVPMAVRALKAGAFDFLEKPFNDQLLLDRVDQAVKFDASQRQEIDEGERVRERKALLTPREHEVMEYVVSGNSNKTIATKLGLSPKTIEVHRAHVMEKMGARSLAELVRLNMSVEKLEKVGI